MALRADWVDSGREPRHPPDPKYPNGLDVDMVTDPAGPTCETELPYPARRCGMFLVQCSGCGLRVSLTTAGRPDDPRSLKVNCLGGKAK